MTWPGCDEKNGLAQVFAEAKYCGNGWCDSDDEQHKMGTDSDTYTPIHRPIGGNSNTWTPTHDIMGNNPCTWAPTIVDGKMTWPGCDEKKGLAQTDAEFNITPGEEKIGMTVGEDVVQAAMAHGFFAQTEHYDPKNCPPGLMC